MLKEFGEYLVAFIDRWLFWVGIVLLIPEILKKIPPWKEWAEKLPHKLFWALGAACIFWATFQVWHEEKVKAKEGAVFVRPAGIFPKTAGISNQDIFPVGERAAVNVHWTVFGPQPALNAMQSGKVYLADDYKYTTQESLVKQFQLWWEEQIRTQYEGHEHSALFPDSSTTEQMWRTYEGPIVTENDKLLLKGDNKVVFVISAVRFDDALGRHEAHLCRWSETHTEGALGTVSWHDCSLWTTQIDIEK